MRKNKGITLIALVITIIVLIILAGVSINLVLGQNGIFNRARQAKEKTEIAAIKEEIEFAILEIETENLENGRNLSMDLLEKELPKKLEDIIVERDDEGKIEGEYKEYDYTIKEDYEVIIGKKGAKPIVTYTLSDETVGTEEVIITLTATVKEGTITKITKPDSKYEENVNEVQYRVTKNGAYKFKVEGSEGGRTTKIVNINNLKPMTPIIASNGIYPKLTPYGIEAAKVSITYDENENLENSYSEDGGTTWKIYNGEFRATGSTIIAKSVVKTNPNCYAQAEENVVVAENALAPEVYDNNQDTCVAVGDQRVKIDANMQGKDLTIVYQTAIVVTFQNENGNEISSESYGNGGMTIYSNTFTIPTGATNLVFTYPSPPYTGNLYELIILDIPQIEVEAHYPILKQDGIEDAYNTVKINYWATSEQKLYKIGEGSQWSNYQGEEIRLELGETIYAKGIDKNGKESNEIAYYTSEISDALHPEAYDNNEETSVAIGGEWLIIDPNMQGKSLTMVYQTAMVVTFQDKKGDDISSESYGNGGMTIYSNTFTIPTGATYLIFTYPSPPYTGNLYEVIISE